MCFSACNL